jgi:sugar/nucleoside kinase (ribokinase family)
MTVQPEKPYDILTFGDLCVDLIVAGEDVVPQFNQVERWVDDYQLEMGGSCSLFACQAARLGLRTAILGRVGRDRFGELVLGRLVEAGVDTSLVMVDPGLKTGLSIALTRGGDRAILTYPGSLNAIWPEDVSDGLLASARHLHHGSFFLHTNVRPAIPAIFERAKQLGLTTSLDPNWDPEERWDLGQVLTFTDVFLPNKQEALHISRRDDLADAAQVFLDQRVSVFAVKRGASGAAVFTAAETIRMKTRPIRGGDSIGAGDSFDAGFLAGWLRNYSLKQCLAFGCACGRAVAGKTGGLAGQLGWGELIELIEQN